MVLASVKELQDPAGQMEFYPEEKIGTLYDTEVFPLPESGASQTINKDPEVPIITLPSEIVLGVGPPEPNRNFVTFEIPYTEFMLFSLPAYTTRHISVLENRTKAYPIAEINVNVVGDSLNNIPQGQPKVTLKNLDYSSGTIPTFEIKVPTTSSSLKYYEGSPTGSLTGTFDILYLASDVSSDGYSFEVFRQNYYFRVPLTLKRKTA